MSITFFCSTCKLSFEHCACPRQMLPAPQMTYNTSPLVMLATADMQTLEAIRQIVAEEVRKALEEQRLALQEGVS